ncbi:cobalamin B12-binding domain-containing protein [Streptomyces sp. NPDC055078]
MNLTGAQRPSPDTHRRHVLVSGVSSDSHTWNLVFLELLLEEMGHEVTNLGSCVPDDLVIEQCRLLRPDLLVISSVNGHGALDGRRMIERLRVRPELRDLTAVIGGKLGVAGGAEGPHGPALLAAGFDAVFEETDGTDAFRRLLGRVAEVPPGPRRPAPALAEPAHVPAGAS